MSGIRGKRTRALWQGEQSFPVGESIAQRLSPIRSADQILVLEGRAIVERGMHEELLERNGLYRQLYDEQYKFERDRFIYPANNITTITDCLLFSRDAMALPSNTHASVTDSWDPFYESGGVPVVALPSTI